MQEKYINPPTDACMFHMHPWVLACFMCVAPKLTKSLLLVTNVICNKKNVMPLIIISFLFMQYLVMLHYLSQIAEFFH
jgi:hypothetical protein